ncbi:MAG: signal peptidase I [bacterium]|nr:signal peptidase I [bacterium]MDA1024572.1 signal peptidase I [bacterium]
MRKKINEIINSSHLGTAGGSFLLIILDLLQVVVIAAIIIVPVRLWVVKPFIVKGASMEEAFHQNDYLVIDQISYKFRDIQRGEVVVFHPPNRPSEHYIKRVIGLPGETVAIAEGEITIYNDEYPNGKILRESYISDETLVDEPVSEVLKENEYYLIGDNRDASLDSRRIGPISNDSIVGRAWIRGLPLEDFGTIPIPNYNL